MKSCENCDINGICTIVGKLESAMLQVLYDSHFIELEENKNEFKKKFYIFIAKRCNCYKEVEK
jgi:hypothetical protein